MSMETTDTPSASADNPNARGSPLLDADPLQPRALEYLADWKSGSSFCGSKQNNAAASKQGGRKPNV